MTWEDVLKATNEDARRLGTEYSPDDMEEFSEKRKLLEPKMQQILQRRYKVGFINELVLGGLDVAIKTLQERRSFTEDSELEEMIVDLENLRD
mgnify:CR=1 FL=1